MQAFLIVIGLMTLGSGLLTVFTDLGSGQNMMMLGACAMVGGGYLMRRELRRFPFRLSMS